MRESRFFFHRYFLPDLYAGHEVHLCSGGRHHFHELMERLSLASRRSEQVQRPDHQTMPIIIANLANGYSIDYGLLMMAVLFCSLPTIIIFFILQKQFAEGITGAVK